MDPFLCVLINTYLTPVLWSRHNETNTTTIKTVVLPNAIPRTTSSLTELKSIVAIDWKIKEGRHILEANMPSWVCVVDENTLRRPRRYPSRITVKMLPMASNRPVVGSIFMLF